MSPKTDYDHVCGGCKRNLKSDAVQCNVCTLWFDMKCSGCDNETAAFLRSAAGKQSSVHWHCTSCDNSTRALHDMVSTINKRVSQVERKLDDLKEGFDSVEVKVQQLDDGFEKANASLSLEIKQAVEALNIKIDSLVESSKQSSAIQTVSNSGHSVSKPKEAADIVSQVAYELEEREKRRLNVVFTGNVDKEKVERFWKAAGTQKPSKLFEIKTQQKTLFIVTMDSEKDKWLLISKARVVSQSKVDLNNIFVNPDLTKTERDLQYQLRQEVRRRREQGENVKIRKGKVIVVQNQ